MHPQVLRKLKFQELLTLKS